MDFNGSPSNYIMPVVIEKSGNRERAYDIYSRLLKDRIIFLQGVVSDPMANAICAQILYLAKESSKKDIQLYINSPGGSITAGLAILDTLRYVPNPIMTLCLGQACSMGAFLLGCAGTKGKRFALPHSRIMIHQASGGAGGQVSDILIQAKEITRLQDMIMKETAEACGQPLKDVEKACDRDRWMSPTEALDFGLIDEVLTEAPKTGFESDEEEE